MRGVAQRKFLSIGAEHVPINKHRKIEELPWSNNRKESNRRIQSAEPLQSLHCHLESMFRERVKDGKFTHLLSELQNHRSYKKKIRACA